MKDLADKFGISSPYGNRAGGFHYGVDIPTPMRQPLYAPEAGTIAFEGDIPAPVAGYPKDRIIILQLAHSFLVFAHLDETVINKGQKVDKNQLIGYTGNSGYSTGPHLHVEEHQGQKSASKGFLAYPSIDVTPRLRGEGDDEVLVIIPRPVSQLNISLKKGVLMWDIVNDKPLWNSGDYMEVTQMTNLVRGKVYWIPKDRANNGELFGFWDKDVTDNASKIHDTQFDPPPSPVVDPVLVEKAKKYDQIKKITA